MIHSCLPVSEFGESWPDGLPVQIHAVDGDPFSVDEEDMDAARALVDEAEDAETTGTGVVIATYDPTDRRPKVRTGKRACGKERRPYGGCRRSQLP